MKKSSGRSGGGISMGITKSGRAGAKVEPRAHAVSPAAVNQMGVSVAFRKEPLVQGRGYEPTKVGPTGIANARKGHEGPGPGGGGRTIYRSGSQGPTPPAKPLPKGPDFLSQFGPERKIGE